MKRIFILALVSLSGCSKKDISNCDDQSSLYRQSNFPIGVAINLDEYQNNPSYRHIADKQFNSFTPENIFKAEYLHPRENVYNWQDADAFVEAGLNQEKNIHGHTLIWHQQLPYWINEFSGTNQEWEALFKSHIQTIVSHFKGKIAAWDVVNEAFNEDGTLRNSIWLDKIGPNYIEKAFIYANEADPDVLLFYNDFNLESNPAKRKSVISYLNTLRFRGVKIDGIGMQMHVSLYSPEPAQIAASFIEVANNEYKIHLSELDISLNPANKVSFPDESLFAEQADYLGKIILHYKQIPSPYQYGITVWGVSDQDSWIPSYYNREDYPLLYDSNYQPKPAYCKLFESL